MEKDHFNQQMKRLSSQFGERAYSEERLAALFAALNGITNDRFVSIVTHLLLNSRSVPLMEDFTSASDLIYEQEKETQRSLYSGNRGFMGVVEDGLKAAPNKELASKCQEVLRDYRAGKINKVQFNQACDYLDQIAALSGPKVCKNCYGSGYAIEASTSNMYRCRCPIGMRMPEQYKVPQSREFITIGFLPNAS